VGRIALLMNQHAVFHGGSTSVLEELEQIRVECGDEEFADHVAIRNYDRAQRELDSAQSLDDAKMKDAAKAKLANAESDLNARPSASAKWDDLQDSKKKSRRGSAA
jgi:hypothetical protein